MHKYEKDINQDCSPQVTIQKKNTPFIFPISSPFHKYGFLSHCITDFTEEVDMS